MIVCGIVAPVEDVEAVTRPVVSVRHLAERRNLVAERLQVLGERADALALVGLVGLGAIPGGHQARQQRGAARRAVGDATNACVKVMPVGGQSAPCSGVRDVSGAVDGRVRRTVVVGQEHTRSGRAAATRSSARASGRPEQEGEPHERRRSQGPLP